MVRLKPGRHKMVLTGLAQIIQLHFRGSEH